jgi:hypothetical protein
MRLGAPFLPIALGHLWGQDQRAVRTTQAVFRPSCAPRHSDRTNLRNQSLEELIRRSHPGEVAGVGDDDQFLLRRLHALEVINCGLGRRNDIVLALDHKERGINVTSRFRKIRRNLIGLDFFAAKDWP